MQKVLLDRWVLILANASDLNGHQFGNCITQPVKVIALCCAQALKAYDGSRMYPDIHVTLFLHFQQSWV